MIKNLVISGGGIKIIGAIGVIKYLEDNSLLKSVENFYGTSAGSILCLMLILNFDSSEIIKFIENFDLNKIFIVNTDNLFTTFNVCDSSKLEKIIKLFINFKLGKISLISNSDNIGTTTAIFDIDNKSEEITMHELYTKTNKYLSVTSVCLDTKTAVYISHETFPNIPVWKAILMSCSIPLIFKPVEWDGKLYVDGALIDNFPLFNIKSNQIKYTLGIQTCLDIQSEALTNELNIYNYIINLIKIVVECETPAKLYNIISIRINPSILNNFLNLNLDKITKQNIINSSYEQTKIQFPKININKLNSNYEQFKTNINVTKNKRSNSF